MKIFCLHGLMDTVQTRIGGVPERIKIVGVVLEILLLTGVVGLRGIIITIVVVLV